MTEKFRYVDTLIKPHNKPIVNDEEIYTKGKFKLREYEDVNYCENEFYYDEEYLSNIEVLELLNEFHEKNQQLKELLNIIADADSARSETSVKEILRNTLFGLDTVAGESPNAFKDYSILNKFFKEHYKELWDNDKYD